MVQSEVVWSHLSQKWLYIKSMFASGICSVGYMVTDGSCIIVFLTTFWDCFLLVEGLWKLYFGIVIECNSMSWKNRNGFLTQTKKNYEVGLYAKLIILKFSVQYNQHAGLWAVGFIIAIAFFSSYVVDNSLRLKLFCSHFPLNSTLWNSIELK